MAKPYQGDWVLRSLLFVPGHVEEMLQKAAVSQADCIVLDLEDAVPEDNKTNGRRLVREVLNSERYGNRTVFVRINSRQSGDPSADIHAVASKNLHGIVYPQVESGEDITEIDQMLSAREHDLGLPDGYFALIALIESPRGILNAQEIAGSSQRLVGLMFGCEDYLAELQGRHCEHEIALHTPRSIIATVTRAAGIEPIDTPYVRVHDLEGLKSFAEAGRNLGMGGMLAVSPRQIPVIHEIYTPSHEEVTEAREVIAKFTSEADPSRGVFISGGRFISPPTYRAAVKTIKRFQAIKNFEDYNKNLSSGKTTERE